MRKNSRSVQLMIAGCILIIFALLLIFPAKAAELAKDGIYLCGTKVIPSLFPFFVLSSLITGLGYGKKLAVRSKKVMKAIFGISGGGTSALLLGLVGGYPTGARTLSELLEKKQISYKEASRLILFCNNCSPAFIFGIAGATVFGSKGGFLLYAAHLLSALLIGVSLKLLFPQHFFESTPAIEAPLPFTTVFTDAVSSALKGVLNVSAFVIFFRIISGLLMLPGILLPGILEMTSGITSLSASSLPESAGLAIASFLLGFGGFSVHFQSISFLQSVDLSAGKYIAAKLLQGFLSAGTAYLLHFLFC